jgi:hypothetical protein
MMDYLPGLTAEQKVFADHFYPVFDDLKSSVLMAAGIILLLEDDQALTDDFYTNLKQISADVDRSAQTWQDYIAPVDLTEDFDVVAGAIQKIAAGIQEVMQLYPQLGKPSIAKMSTDLLEAYQDLRTVALDYWRLELVAESAGHFHGHGEHHHRAEN